MAFGISLGHLGQLDLGYGPFRIIVQLSMLLSAAVLPILPGGPYPCARERSTLCSLYRPENTTM
jgi:hypothetical protein